MNKKEGVVMFFLKGVFNFKTFVLNAWVCIVILLSIIFGLLMDKSFVPEGLVTAFSVTFLWAGASGWIWAFNILEKN